jgi:hypothetical protein
MAEEPLYVSLLPWEGEGPAEDLRAGPKLALYLPIKAPSFQGPADRGTGSVDWNGNEVANALDLGLDLDLTSAATFAARAAGGFAQGSRLKAQGFGRSHGGWPCDTCGGAAGPQFSSLKSQFFSVIMDLAF